MEINTGKVNKEPESPAVSVPPDRGRQARKKTVQKIPRNGHMAARLLALLRLLAGVSAVAVVVIGVLYAYRYAYTSDTLALRTITIEGCKHSDPAVLEAIIRQSSHVNVLRIDLNRLRTRIEQEPWIRKAEIRRILPGNLRIYVQERAPSVIAEIGGELELLDNEGVLLDRYAPSYGKLDVPVFRGLKGDSAEAYKVLREENSARVSLGVQLLTELAAGPSDFTRAISEVDLSDPTNVKVLLVDDAADIYLGDRDFLKRFQAFMAVYEDVKLKYGEITSADLRLYPKIIYKQPEGQQKAAGAASKAGNRN